MADLLGVGETYLGVGRRGELVSFVEKRRAVGTLGILPFGVGILDVLCICGDRSLVAVARGQARGNELVEFYLH